MTNENEQDQFPEHPPSRLSNITVWLLIFIALASWVIGGSYWYYITQSKLIRQHKANELTAIAQLKISQITYWRGEWLSDARMNANSLFFTRAVAGWLEDPQNIELRKDLITRLRLITELDEYPNAILAAPDGTLLLSADSRVSSLDEETQALAAEASRRGEPVLGDFVRQPETGRATVFVAAPFRADNSTPLAVLLLEINPDKQLYPLIQSWPIPSRSAETLLLRAEGDTALFLNTLRFRSDPPLTFSLPLSKTTIPAVQAALGITGEFEGVDYRGHEVLAVILPVPDSTWKMVAKVDQDEIFAEVRSLASTVIIVVILAIAAVGLFGVYIFNYRQRRLYQTIYYTQQEKNKSEEETHITLYSIGDGVITTDREGRVTRLNPVAEKLTGWTEAEAIGKPLKEIFRIVNEFTRAEAENPAERIFREGLIVGLANHTLLIARDGTERPIADSGAPIREKGGKILGAVLVFRDQSQERAMERERALLTYTISRSVNEIYMFDAQSLRFRFVNEGALKNLGYSLEHIRQMTPLDIKPEFTLESFRQHIQPLLDHQIQVLAFETIHKRADGSVYPVMVYLQLFDYEGEQIFLAVINDITEQKRAEKFLSESEARYRSLFQNQHTVMLLIDPDTGKIVDANPAAGLFYGWSVEELKQMNINQINTLPAEAIHAEMELARTQKRKYFNFKHLLKDGSIRDVEVFSGPIQYSDKTLLYSIIHDITERRRVETLVAEQLEELRRWHQVALGREDRILELKQEVNEVLAKAGLPPRYSAASVDKTDD